VKRAYRKLVCRLVCRLRGHRLERTTLYLTGEVLSVTRCSRCKHVEDLHETKVKQYPKSASRRVKVTL
jgi:hypothetical protein